MAKKTKKEEVKSKIIEEKKALKPEVEEKEEDFLESNKRVKRTKDEKEKSLFSKIMNVVLWVVLIAWMIIVLIDYFRVTEEKQAIFCLSNKTIKYDDGTVDSCLGLGYRVYNYNRDSFKAIEFGPFWIKDRSAQTTEK